MPAWHVYVLRTSSNALYTGITTDVAARVEQHAAGRGAKCLRGRGPLVLVYRVRVGDVGLALRAERALKALTKLEKEALTAARPARQRFLRRLGIDVAPVAGKRSAGKRKVAGPKTKPRSVAAEHVRASEVTRPAHGGSTRRPGLRARRPHEEDAGAELAHAELADAVLGNAALADAERVGAETVNAKRVSAGAVGSNGVRTPPSTSKRARKRRDTSPATLVNRRSRARNA